MSDLSDKITETILRELMGRRSVKEPLFELKDQDLPTFQEMTASLSAQIDEILNAPTYPAPIPGPVNPPEIHGTEISRDIDGRV